MGIIDAHQAILDDIHAKKSLPEATVGENQDFGKTLNGGNKIIKSRLLDRDIGTSFLMDMVKIGFCVILVCILLKKCVLDKVGRGKMFKKKTSRQNSFGILMKGDQKHGYQRVSSRDADDE